MSDEGDQPETVEELLDSMSLEEKVAQLGTVRIGTLLTDGELDEEKAREQLSDGIGRVTRAGRESYMTPEKLRAVVGGIQEFLRTETSHGIPAIVREESVCGYAGRGGTAFPQSIGLASTWNPDIVRQVAEKIRDQLSAVGVDLTLSPVADVARDPRWGRIEETYGEDPSLVATMTSAFVRGLQKGSAEKQVHATLKHFAGHGVPEGGRNRASVNLSERVLREQHLLPFEAGMKRSDAASVMAAYHDIDGVPCHASRNLLRGILRDEWGFDGTVVSDGRGIEMLHTHHNVADDREEAGLMALEAGIDVEVPETECFGDHLVDAVRDDSLDERRVDEAARRHLQQKADLGLLGEPKYIPPVEDAFEGSETDVTSAVRSIAHESARQSLVLLKNDSGLLPLGNPDSVAVIGPNADDTDRLLGNYSYAGVEPPGSGVDLVTPLEGIKSAVGDDVEVTHEAGCDVRGDEESRLEEAAAVAADAEVAVVCVGGSSGINVEMPSSATTGEALDRTDLGLPGRQRELVEAIHGTGTPVVAVLINGRPLSTPWLADNVPAVVEAWLPGEEGGNAVAEVLFGHASPGGKLPVSVPGSVGQVPIHYSRPEISLDHEHVFGDDEPLYPFGHGESYTEFDYTDLSIEPDECAPEHDVEVSVTVENVGDRAGDEVVQVYASDESASVVRPSKQLVGFERVELTPGEESTLTFKVPTAQLAYYDREMVPVLEPGRVKLQVGSSSQDIRLEGSFELVGSREQVDSRARFTTVEKE